MAQWVRELTPEEEHDAWCKVANEIGEEVHQAIVKELGSKPHILFSCYTEAEGEDGMITNNLKDVAFHGKAIFQCKRDVNWCASGAEDWQSGIVENPTWLELAVLAERAIRVARDYAHVFFEGFDCNKPDAITERDEDGIPIFTFYFGS